MKVDGNFLHSRNEFFLTRLKRILWFPNDGTHLLPINDHSDMAFLLPLGKGMNTICRHCDELIVGKAYRVTSEDEGIIMLDMIVCRLCFMEARKLGLHAEVMVSRSNQFQLATEVITAHDSASNFNTGSSSVQSWG